MPLLISVLALAIFAQGTSEFMLAGLLSLISEDLGVTPGVAGTLTSAFAVGMVVGAPLMAVLAARWRPRRALVLFLLVFMLAHVVGAFASSFGVLLATRVLAAFANAGFLAVALGAVRRLLPEGQTTRGVATLLAGTTLATIVGVPAGAAFAAALGWRSTFWGIVLLCVPALFALLVDRSLADAAGGSRIRLRAELGDLARRPVAGAIVLAVLVNAATFGVFTYLGLIGEDSRGDSALTPLLLAVFGVGAFLGVTATGRWAAVRERAWIVRGLTALTVSWGAFAVLVAQPVAVFALAFVAGGLSFAVGSALIGRVVREASGAPVLGGAYATVALNLGAVGGPVLAGFAYGAQGAPAVPAAAFVVTAVALAAVLWALPRAGGATPRRM